jgi:L,D-transpeptidase YcfS
MEISTVDMNTYNPKNLDRIVIYINSTNNFMTVNGYKNQQKFKLNKYKVSTAKPDVKKPEGKGGISSISLHPIWYPTAETLDYFKKVRNIELPKVIPPESPYNYMGSAKISLTHSVDGRQTYRIHGTINEKTIGKHESAGCIRMKNNDVLTLAKYLKEFASTRGMKQILVVMD